MVLTWDSIESEFVDGDSRCDVLTRLSPASTSLRTSLASAGSDAELARCGGTVPAEGSGNLGANGHQGVSDSDASNARFAARGCKRASASTSQPRRVHRDEIHTRTGATIAVSEVAPERRMED